MGRARLIDGRPKEVSVTPTSAIKWINYGNNWSDQSGQGAIGEQCRSNYIPVEVVRLAQPSSCTRACMHACGGWCTMDARRRFLQREVNEVREGASVTRGGGEEEKEEKYAGRWTTARMHTDHGWMLVLLGFLSTKREAEKERDIHDRLATPTLFEIDNSGIRICLTNRNDLIRINRGS